MNFGNLKADIALWLARSDLSQAMPSFVRTAEAEFRRDSRLIDILSSATAVGLTTDGSIPMPSDLLQLTELRVAGRLLRKLPFADGRAATGDYFYQSGSEYLLVSKPQGEWAMVYDRALKPLVADDDENWLLAAAPDVYLWKCCEIGSIYLQDATAATGYNAKYSQAVDQLVSARNSQEWGGAPVSVAAPGVV